MRYSEINHLVERERSQVQRLNLRRDGGDAILDVVRLGGDTTALRGRTGELALRRQEIFSGNDPDFVMADYPRTIDWVVPKTARHAVENGTETVVWIDPAKLDAEFSATRDYVGRDGAGGINGRYPGFDGWVRQGEPVEMSEVYLDYAGRVSFTNGRHRFAWMRDHGAKAVPVVVPHNQAREITTRYSAAERATMLESADRVLVEGLIDNLKKAVGDRVDNAVLSVQNGTTAIRVLYRAISNPTYLTTVIHLLRKSIGDKLKTLRQKFPEAPIVKKFVDMVFRLRPSGETIRDMLKCLAISCVLNSVMVLVDMAGEGLKKAVEVAMKSEFGAMVKRKMGEIGSALSDKIPDEVEGYLGALSGQMIGVDRLVAAVTDASGFFALMKGLGIANELLFRELTRVNNRISTIRVGAGAV